MNTLLIALSVAFGALSAEAAILDNFHNVPLSTFLRERGGFQTRGLGCVDRIAVRLVLSQRR